MERNDQPAASVPDSDDDTVNVQHTSKNVARVAMAAMHGDLDDFTGLNHPAIARTL